MSAGVFVGDCVLGCMLVASLWENLTLSRVRSIGGNGVSVIVGGVG